MLSELEVEHAFEKGHKLELSWSGRILLLQLCASHLAVFDA